MIGKLRDWYLDRRDARLGSYLPYVWSFYYKGSDLDQRQGYRGYYISYKGVEVIRVFSGSPEWANPHLTTKTKAKIMREYYNLYYAQVKSDNQEEFERQVRLKKEARKLDD